MGKIMVSAAAAAIMLAAAAPAFAATDNSLSPDDARDLCTKLESQYQFLTPFKKGEPYWKKASAEFRDGRQDCTGGKPVAGAEAMQTAISDMYVAPDTL